MLGLLGSSGFWGLAGNLISGIFADKAAKRSEQRAAQFAEATEFKPFDVTDPTGQATFEDGRATTTLNPELQAQLDALLVQSTQFGEAGTSFDPFEAQQEIYEQQQSLFAPAQEQDRLALESRLLQQGLLGSTTGALQTGALRTAQEQANVSRQAQALQQAQSIQAQQQQQQLGALQGAVTLAQMPGKLLAQGGSLGGQQSAAASLGQQAMLQTGMSRDTGRAGMFEQIGAGVSKFGQDKIQPRTVSRGGFKTTPGMTASQRGLLAGVK